MYAWGASWDCERRQILSKADRPRFAVRLARCTETEIEVLRLANVYQVTPTQNAKGPRRDCYHSVGGESW